MALGGRALAYWSVGAYSRKYGILLLIQNQIFRCTFLDCATILGKIHFVLDLLARDISNPSYAPNKPLTKVLNPLSEKFLF